MGVKLKDIPTTTLMSAQTAIEFASREMHGFFQQVLKDFNEGKLPPVYVKELEDSLEKKIENNNKVLDDIEKEVFSRIEKLFPNCTTSKNMKFIVNRYQEELKKYQPKDKKPVLSLNTSKEVVK